MGVHECIFSVYTFIGRSFCSVAEALLVNLLETFFFQRCSVNVVDPLNEQLAFHLKQNFKNISWPKFAVLMNV